MNYTTKNKSVERTYIFRLCYSTWRLYDINIAIIAHGVNITIIVQDI